MARRWKALAEQHAALPLDEYLAMATQLSDDQWGSLSTVAHELELPPIVPAYPSLRPALQLLAGLGPVDRQTLLGGQPLAMEQMTAPQRELFLAAVYQDSRIHGEPLDLAAERAAEPSPTARFWLTAERLVRVQERREAGASYGDVLAAAPGDAPIGGAEAGPPTPAAPARPGAARRFPVTRLSFHLQYGEETDPHGAELIVAPPLEARP
jgi:hypothetical protein